MAGDINEYPGMRPPQYGGNNPQTDDDREREATVLVVDKGNCRVQEFTFSGDHLSAFGQKGNRDGDLSDPWDIAVMPATGDVAVLEWLSHRVSIFSPVRAFDCSSAPPHAWHPRAPPSYLYLTSLFSSPLGYSSLRFASPPPPERSVQAQVRWQGTR